MGSNREVLRIVMVLHDIRDYAHGYVDPSVRSEINRTLDTYQDLDGPPGPAASEMKGVLLALASEAETLARRLAGGPDTDAAGLRDVFLATLASRCRSAIATPG